MINPATEKVKVKEIKNLIVELNSDLDRIKKFHYEIENDIVFEDFFNNLNTIFDDFYEYENKITGALISLEEQTVVLDSIINKVYEDEKEELVTNNININKSECESED